MFATCIKHFETAMAIFCLPCNRQQEKKQSTAKMKCNNNNKGSIKRQTTTSFHQNQEQVQQRCEACNEYEVIRNIERILFFFFSWVSVVAASSGNCLMVAFSEHASATDLSRKLPLRKRVAPCSFIKSSGLRPLGTLFSTETAAVRPQFPWKLRFPRANCKFFSWGHCPPDP